MVWGVVGEMMARAIDGALCEERMVSRLLEKVAFRSWWEGDIVVL